MQKEPFVLWLWLGSLYVVSDVMNLKIVETCPSKCMFQRGISDINYIYNIMD